MAYWGGPGMERVGEQHSGGERTIGNTLPKAVGDIEGAHNRGANGER